MNNIAIVGYAQSDQMKHEGNVLVCVAVAHVEENISVGF